MNVQIDISSDSRYLIDRKRIRRSIEETLLKDKVDGNVEISVRVVGARKMKSLNGGYRKKDYANNVLSFCQQDLGPSGEGFVYPEDGVLYLGDIVVCYPVARDQAGEKGVMVDDWIDELVAHSTKHLLGHHHS